MMNREMPGWEAPAFVFNSMTIIFAENFPQLYEIGYIV